MKRRRVGRRWLIRLAIAVGAGALVAAALLVAVQTSPGGTLDRIRNAGRIAFGYQTDLRPFSYRDESGAAAGYSIALCGRIAHAARRELQDATLKIEWVPVNAQDRFAAVQHGTVDLLCEADTVTYGERSEVAFSKPIFLGGIGALLRSDAPARLRDVLNESGDTLRPTWRAYASHVLEARTFAVVAGSTAETWLVGWMADHKIHTTIAPVGSYDAGVEALLARRVDALFGERAILFDASRRRGGGRELVVLGRLFNSETVALALAPNDEAFRLFVDRTLMRFYASGGFSQLYTQWFAEPDESAHTFFGWNTPPE